MRFKPRVPPLFVCSLALTIVLAGCTGNEVRPVFYPNAHSEAQGQAQRERDINDCMSLAEQVGIGRNRDGEVGKKAAGGALVGGIASGAWGLVRGDAGERALAGALAGGAAGGVKGGIDSTRLNPTFKRFVERCLGDRGYEVIGWE